MPGTIVLRFKMFTHTTHSFSPSLAYTHTLFPYHTLAISLFDRRFRCTQSLTTTLNHRCTRMVWQMAVQRCTLYLSINYAIKYRLTRYKFPKHLKFKQCLENCILLFSQRRVLFLHDVSWMHALPANVRWRIHFLAAPLSFLCTTRRHNFKTLAAVFDQASKLFLHTAQAMSNSRAEII